MEQNERKEVRSETFRIEDGTETPVPLTRQRWFRIAAVLLVLAIVAIAVVYTQGDAFMASWYASRAESKAGQGDYDGAITDISHAIDQTPDNTELYLKRGEYQLQADDPNLEGALADFNHVLEMDPGYSNGYVLRSVVYQRLAFLEDDPARSAELHAKAIADLQQAQPHLPKDDAVLLNQLAYSRALAGTELDQALAEINTALDKVDAQKLLASVEEEPIDVNDLRRALEIRSFLDTRGFVQHLRGEQDAALEDMNLSIDLHQAAVRAALNRLADQTVRDNFEESNEKIYAVLLHHRGLIYQALGKEEQAQADLNLAEELGFDPQAGVY